MTSTEDLAVATLSNENGDTAGSNFKHLVLQQMLGISVVALVLTALEVISLVQTVFPDLRRFTLKKLEKAGDDMDLPDYVGVDLLKPALKTLGERERDKTELTNSYIIYFAVMFCVLMLIAIFYFRSRIIQESNALRTGSGLLWVYFYAILTLIGILYFQGIGCLLGLGFLCSPDSFVQMTKDWKQPKAYQEMVLSTGVCDGIADFTSSTRT